VPNTPILNAVTATAAASAADAVAHFGGLLAYETDCWDVHESLSRPDPGFVVLDVRSPELFTAGHIPGAVNLPPGRIVPRNLSGFSDDLLFIVYCAGPHCNGADKAALRLARLGRAVKKMIGGVEGWRAEGFPLAKAED
jgi:rhodanese-related sulfurtransferase